MELQLHSCLSHGRGQQTFSGGCYRAMMEVSLIQALARHSMKIALTLSAVPLLVTPATERTSITQAACRSAPPGSPKAAIHQRGAAHGNAPHSRPADTTVQKAARTVHTLAVVWTSRRSVLGRTHIGPVAQSLAYQACTSTIRSSTVRLGAATRSGQAVHPAVPPAAPPGRLPPHHRLLHPATGSTVSQRLIFGTVTVALAMHQLCSLGTPGCTPMHHSMPPQTLRGMVVLCTVRNYG